MIKEQKIEFRIKGGYELILSNVYIYRYRDYSLYTVSSPLEIHGVSSELVYVSRTVYLILIYI